MNLKKRLLALAGALFVSTAVSTVAFADGNLFIYNWSDYTAPDVIAKFEKETGIKVTLDTYDSNETLLAKLKQGGVGYDIVVPSHNFVPIMISEGLLQRVNAKKLDGYRNIAKMWRSPPWDKKNRYSVPWQWGTTSYAVDTARFSGDINTYKVLFDPPSALQGQIGMFKAPDEVIPMAQIYLGVPLCSENPQDMKRVSELLEAQKAHVKVYNSDGIKERLVSGDTAVHTIWNGYALRSRQEKSSLAYAYPTEGVLTWFDSLTVPKGAKNYDNALRFISFMLQPENAAMQSNFAGYANGIDGSAKFMSDDLKTAPEVNSPAGMKSIFTESCSEKAIQLADRAWTRLLK